MFYSSFSREEMNADFSWSMWQCCGQHIIFTVLLVQSISGLWHFSQENPRMNVFFPRSMASAMIFLQCPWYLTISSAVWVILSVKFHVPSMLYTGIEFCKGKSSNLCFSAHALSIKIVFAPELRSASSLIKSFWLLANVS